MVPSEFIENKVSKYSIPYEFTIRTKGAFDVSIRAGIIFTNTSFFNYFLILFLRRINVMIDIVARTNIMIRITLLLSPVFGNFSYIKLGSFSACSCSSI